MAALVLLCSVPASAYDAEIDGIFYNLSEQNAIVTRNYSKDYEGTILKGWGAPLDFLRTQQGFFFVVLLPMIIFFMYALVRVVLSATGYKKAKAEEEKEEAVKEAVAEALASKGAESQEAVSANASTGMTAEELEQFRQFQEFQKMQKAQSEQAAEPKEEPKNEE